jgi:hypothetical protein
LLFGSSFKGFTGASIRAKIFLSRCLRHLIKNSLYISLKINAIPFLLNYRFQSIRIRARVFKIIIPDNFETNSLKKVAARWKTHLPF